MHRLSTSDRARAVACLVEGNSQRATCRITGLSRKGVARLADDLGAACERFMGRVMVDLPCRRIQCDEFSKTIESHRLACALHFAHYNFCRIHQTLRVTPAMESGLTDHVWSTAELIGLLEAEESLPVAA